MRAVPEISDPIFKKKVSYNALDSFFIKLIQDERDLPFIHLTLKIIFLMLPMALCLFIPALQGWWRVGLSALYLGLLTFVFIGPFSLMLHCTSHRRFFKKDYDYLNHFLPWVVAPFFGHSPETYHSHHIGMHHTENNLEEDDSTTMPFQRDSFLGFLRYFGAFLFTGIYYLAMYFVRKNRKKLLVKSVRGEALFILFCIAMCLVNTAATIVVFVVPFFLYRFIAMFGNWTQHAFIDAADPGNSYKNSITCINTPYNHQCFNDGYHISHHLKQSMHWTEHPVFFQKTLQDYASSKSVVFEGLDFVQVYLYLMFKRYDLLAKHFVNFNNTFSSDEEVIAFLKERTKPVAFGEHAMRAEPAMAME